MRKLKLACPHCGQRFDPDPELIKALLERNLPAGQNWVNGKASKDWVLSHWKDPDRKGIDQAQFWETKDGKLWAFYNPEEKAFLVGTPQGFKKLASLAETESTGGF